MASFQISNYFHDFSHHLWSIDFQTHLQPRSVTYAHLIKCLKLLMGRSNEHLYWRLYQLSTAEWQTVPKCSGLKNNHDFICHFCQFQLLQISSNLSIFSIPNTLIQTPFASHFSRGTVSCWAPFSCLALFRSILHSSAQWTFQKFKQVLMALLFKTQHHLVALSIRPILHAVGIKGHLPQLHISPSFMPPSHWKKLLLVTWICQALTTKSLPWHIFLDNSLV